MTARIISGKQVSVRMRLHAVKGRASAGTPVPGAVAPMMITMLLHNTIRSCGRTCGWA